MFNRENLCSAAQREEDFRGRRRLSRLAREASDRRAGRHPESAEFPDRAPSVRGMNRWIPCCGEAATPQAGRKTHELRLLWLSGPILDRLFRSTPVHSRPKQLQQSPSQNVAGQTRIGVRSFLFIVLSICTALPVSLLGLSQAHKWAMSEVAAADRQSAAAAQSAANQLMVAMQGYVRAADSFSAQLMARRTWDRAILESVMNAHWAHHPEFLGTYVAKENGQSVLNLSSNGKFAETHIDYSDRDYYAELVATKRTVVSRAAIGRVTRVLTVQVVAPMLDETQKLTGFTCSSVDLGTIANQAKQSARGMASGRVVIIDYAGQLIADSEVEAGSTKQANTKLAIFAPVAVGNTEVRMGTDEHHQLVRGAAVGLPAPIAGWRAIATSPKATIDANARRVMVQTATMALILIVVMIGLAAWVAAWISRPLRALATSAQAVADGSLLPSPHVRRGVPEEMAQLILSVESMITRLRVHADDLESQIEARTESLAAANRGLTAAITTIQQNERRVRDDIAQARLFQQKMLPVVPQRLDLDIAIVYSPLERVSGDIYDVYEIGEKQIRIFVADATGHGVQGSMRTILLKSVYDRIKMQQRSPRGVLRAMNEFLVQQFPGGDLHCTACCLDIRLVPGGAEVVYADAANGPLLKLTEGEPTEELYQAGPLIGVDSIDTWEEQRLTMHSGQLLIVSTDGLTEQFNADRERFETVLTQLQLQPRDTAESFNARLWASFDRFRGEQPMLDDITVITVRLNHAAQASEQ